MQTSGLGIHQPRQSIHIGGLQFAEASVVENLSRQLMLQGQLRQHVLIGRIAGLGFFDRRKLELFKEHFAELLRRIHIEFNASQPIDPL